MSARLCAMVAMGALAAPLLGGEAMHDAHGDADDTGHAMKGHMDDDPLRGMLRADRLEWQSDGTADRVAWSLDGWIGKDEGRLWIRSDGERSRGRTEESDVEALWGRPLSPWWDVVAGGRHDFAPAGSRNWAALGLVGIAPYEFEMHLTAYVGEHGTVALNAEIELDLLLTQRLVLQPRIETTWLGRRDVARNEDAGLSKAAAGLRLRYEIRRELAPYVGVEWSRRGDEDTLTAVAGLRAWL